MLFIATEVETQQSNRYNRASQDVISTEYLVFLLYQRAKNTDANYCDDVA